MAENFLVTLRVEFDVVRYRQKLTLWQPGTGMQHEDENRDVLLFCLSIQESAVLIYSASKVNVPPAIAGYEPIGMFLLQEHSLW